MLAKEMAGGWGEGEMLPCGSKGFLKLIYRLDGVSREIS